MSESRDVTFRDRSRLGPAAARAGQALVTLWGASVLIFALQPLAGDPVAEYVRARGGINPTAQQVARVRRQLGLDHSLAWQYLSWLGRVLHGDLGTSFQTGQPVGPDLAHRLATTAILAGTAVALALAASIVLGVLSVASAARWPDTAIRVFCSLGVAIPDFIVGLVLIEVVVLRLGIGQVISDGAAAHVALPAVALALFPAARWTQVLRAGLADALAAPYCLVAAARGARRARVVVRYALPNALPPYLTLIGIEIATLAGGTAVIEGVFSWPGVGLWLVDAVRAQDLPEIQAFTLLATACFVIASLLIDLLLHRFETHPATGSRRSRRTRPTRRERRKRRESPFSAPTPGAGFGAAVDASPVAALPPDGADVTPTPERRRLRRLSSRRMAWPALAVLLVLVAAALIGPWAWPASPFALHPLSQLRSPGWAHPLGTDEHGRDELARLLAGARQSLLVAVMVLALAVTGGVALGVLAGLGGRVTDTLICRLCDILLAFPPLVAALAVLTALGSGLIPLIAAVTVSFVGEFARFARTYTHAARGRPLITVARMAGIPGWRIALTHIVPETVSKVLVLASMLAGHVLVTVASLSYLGFGPQPPAPEWGAMLSDAQTYLAAAPWLVYAPAAALVALVLSCNALGVAFDDASRPGQPR